MRNRLDRPFRVKNMCRDLYVYFKKLFLGSQLDNVVCLENLKRVIFLVSLKKAVTIDYSGI